MKKILKTTIFAGLLIFSVAPMGCVKTDGTNSPLSALPDLTNFAIEAVSTWVAGASSLISLASTSLGDGTFTVNYNITGADAMSGLTATINMSGGHGSFQTPVMSTAGENNIVITSITNGSGGSSSLNSHNSYTFSDSCGLMTATINGVAYRATHVQASLAGDLLSIHAVKWTPLTTITLYIDHYTNSPVTMTFTSPSDFAGGTSYGAPGTAELGDHGNVVVTTASPLISGTFNFTNTDGSVITGSYSCPHP